MEEIKKDINLDIAHQVNLIEQEIQKMDSRDALAKVWKEREELESLLKQQPLLLMIAGNIGFGKTTVTAIIGTYGKIEEIKEPVDNPLLSLYYEDMNRYSERLQLDLINVRLTDMAIKRLKSSDKSVIFDRTHYEDTLIFSEVLAQQNLMSQESLEFCNWYFKMKKSQIESRYGVNLTPDLIVMLQGSMETGWRRVQGRDRKIEVRDDAGKGVGLSREFYQALHNQYEVFPKKLNELYSGPLLILPQDTLEVADATNSKGQLYVIRSVKEALKLINLMAR